MAVPVLVWSETNGTSGSQTTTDNITVGVIFASVDSVSATGLISADPVNTGQNSYEKWWRAKVTTASSNTLSSFGVSFSATAVQDNGGNTNTLTQMFATNHAYATPTSATSTIATTNTNTDTSAPGTSVTAPANTVGAYSSYITLQNQVASNAAGGNMVFPSPWMTLTYSYS